MPEVPDTWEEVTNLALLETLVALMNDNLPEQPIIDPESGVAYTPYLLDSIPWYEFRHLPTCRWYRVKSIPA